MATIQIKRGPQSAVTNLVLAPGELAVALDTGNVYIGTSTGNVHLNPPGGTADVATKLQTPRDFSAAGDATAPAVSFRFVGKTHIDGAREIKRCTVVRSRFDFDFDHGLCHFSPGRKEEEPQRVIVVSKRTVILKKQAEVAAKYNPAICQRQNHLRYLLVEDRVCVFLTVFLGKNNLPAVSQ